MFYDLKMLPHYVVLVSNYACCSEHLGTHTVFVGIDSEKLCTGVMCGSSAGLSAELHMSLKM
jgi:hypothetical protein